MQSLIYMQEGTAEHLPASLEKSASRSQFLMPFFVIVALIVALLTGLYLLGATTKKDTPLLSAKPTATTVPTLTFVPTASQTIPTPLARKDFSIIVLNGSGIAGSAGGISSQLQSLGYTITRTGNAARFNYQGITILLQEKESPYLAQLQTDIEEAAAGKTITVETDETITTDAEVIVGR
ncbi:MAG: LytR C-terminal domain-containing protein [Patescibacteria group bacterium]